MDDEDIQVPGSGGPWRIIGVIALVGALGGCCIATAVFTERSPRDPVVEPPRPPAPAMARTEAERAAIEAIAAELDRRAAALQVELDQALSLRGRVTPSALACPVELPEPPRAGPGETLLQASMRTAAFHPIVARGETVPWTEVVRLRGLAARTREDTEHTVDELRRWAAARPAEGGPAVVYFERERVAPLTGQNDYEFTPGRTAGTAYLFRGGEMLCVAEIQATNSSDVRLQRARDSLPGREVPELNDDLANERDRAIARGMRSIAPAPAP